MTQATLKRDSAPTDSVAFQYLREQVARQMAGVYSAYETLPVREEKATEPQAGSEQSSNDSKE